jgi:hypothetical protein
LPNSHCALQNISLIYMFVVNISDPAVVTEILQCVSTLHKAEKSAAFFWVRRHMTVSDNGAARGRDLHEEQSSDLPLGRDVHGQGYHTSSFPQACPRS